MLVMLLIYTFKKAFKRSPYFEIAAVLKMYLFKIKYIIPFFLLANTSTNSSAPEVEKISFSIIKKNSSIGFIDIEKTSINETTTYIINSKVNTKVIFNFDAVGMEKSIYRKDTLVFSSMYRKLNNKVKLNQSIALINGKYISEEKNKKEALDINIIYRNLVTLFFFEPLGIKEIYSDKFKEMVKVTCIGQGKYKVVLPNKGTSIYHYKNGSCTMIEVIGTFYKVRLMPTIDQNINKIEL
jgi:hypothetical protein